MSFFCVVLQCDCVSTGAGCLEFRARDPAPSPSPALTVTLPPDGKHIPGWRPFAEPITIAGMEDEIEVLRSLQVPKKVRIMCRRKVGNEAAVPLMVDVEMCSQDQDTKPRPRCPSSPRVG